MGNIHQDTKAVQAISPQSANNTTINGTTIALAGYEGIQFICAVGAQDAIVTFKVQQGDQSDASDMADVSGLSQAFSATDDNKVCKLTLHRSTKAYSRVVAVVASGTAQLIGAVGELYGGHVHPETAQSLAGAFVTN